MLVSLFRDGGLLIAGGVKEGHAPHFRLPPLPLLLRSGDGVSCGETRGSSLQQRITGMPCIAGQSLPSSVAASQKGVSVHLCEIKRRDDRPFFADDPTRYTRRLFPGPLTAVGRVGSRSRVKCPRCVSLLSVGAITPRGSWRRPRKRYPGGGNGKQPRQPCPLQNPLDRLHPWRAVASCRHKTIDANHVFRHGYSCI